MAAVFHTHLVGTGQWARDLLAVRGGADHFAGHGRSEGSGGNQDSGREARSRWSETGPLSIATGERAWVGKTLVTGMTNPSCARCGRPLRDGDPSCPWCGFSAGAQPVTGYGAPLPPSSPSGPFAPTAGGPSPAGGAPFWPPSPVEPRRARVGVGLLATLTIAALVVGLCIGLGAGYGGARLLNSGTSQAHTPQNTVVFHDPLTSNVNGWLSDSTHCSFQDGGYLVQNDYLCLAPVGAFRDVAVSVKARQVGGPITWFYGIVVRQAAGNYYEADIDSNGKWVIRKVVNDQSTEIKPYLPSPAIKHGLDVTNTLKVIAQGSRLTFFVNGTRVGQVTDSSFGRGRIGLGASGQGVQVVYDDLTISTVS